MLSIPMQMMLVALAGWVNESQLAVIEYLKEEIRVLRELQGKRRIRFTDDQRRRLAAKGKALGRRVLKELGLTFKKKTIHAAAQDRPDVVQRRHEWRTFAGEVDAGRLLIIDGAWLAACTDGGVRSVRGAPSAQLLGHRPSLS